MFIIVSSQHASLRGGTFHCITIFKRHHKRYRPTIDMYSTQYCATGSLRLFTALYRNRTYRLNNPYILHIILSVNRPTFHKILLNWPAWSTLVCWVRKVWRWWLTALELKRNNERPPGCADMSPQVATPSPVRNKMLFKKITQRFTYRSLKKSFM